MNASICSAVAQVNDTCPSNRISIITCHGPVTLYLSSEQEYDERNSNTSLAFDKIGFGAAELCTLNSVIPHSQPDLGFLQNFMCYRPASPVSRTSACMEYGLLLLPFFIYQLSFFFFFCVLSEEEVKDRTYTFKKEYRGL